MGAHHAHHLPPRDELRYDGRSITNVVYPPKGASTSTAPTDELFAIVMHWLKHFWIAIALGGVAGFWIGVLL